MKHSFGALQREVKKLLNERPPESESDRLFWHAVWRMDAIQERVAERLRVVGCADLHAERAVLVVLQWEAARLSLATKGKVRRAAEELDKAIYTVSQSGQPEVVPEVIKAARTTSDFPAVAKPDYCWWQEGSRLLQENLAAEVAKAKSVILRMWGVPMGPCNGMPQRPRGEPPPVEFPAWLAAMTDDELREYVTDTAAEP